MSETTDESRFWLREKSEILYVLRSMQARRASLEICPSGSQRSCLTLLLAVDDAEILFDPPAGEDDRRCLLTAKRLSCRGKHEQVEVRFELGRLNQREGEVVLVAALPNALWRQQRREFYRLAAPKARLLLCQLPLPDGGSVEAPLLDLSGGGVALIAPPAGLVLTPGMRFAPCRLELPEVGQIEATLEVRNCFEVTLKSGHRVQRAGCAFINLPDMFLTLIQRYIIKVERERKARECGLG